MPHIISMINLKGGVGKTTTTVGLAQFLAGLHGKRVLVVDLDPQTNATAMLIGDSEWEKRNKDGLTLATLFRDALDQTDKFDLNDAVIKNACGLSDVKTLDLLPSSPDLIDVQDNLINMPRGKYYSGTPVEIIGRATRQLMRGYDYVFIDCPPNLGLITLNGLNISSGYIVPTIPDNLSTYGIPQILARVSGFGKDRGEEIRPLGILVTKYRRGTKLHMRVHDFLCRKEGYPPVFRTLFTENIQFAQAGEYASEINSLTQRWGLSGGEPQGPYDQFNSFAKELMALLGDGGEPGNG